MDRREQWVKNMILVKGDGGKETVYPSQSLCQMHSLSEGAEILCISFISSAAPPRPGLSDFV